MTDPNNPAPGTGGQPYPYGTPSPGAPVPPPPPGQQPAAPQQPYGANPYGQTPQQPYQQAPQQPYSAAPQPPYPGYPAPPPYPTAPEQPKKKVWPWVLGGCLLMFVLGIGGCVGCVSCAIMLDNANPYGRDYDYSYSDPYRDYDYDPYGYQDDGDADVFGSVTLEDIERAAGDLPSRVENGRCTSGVFEVGAGKDLEPGRYFLEGSADVEGSYYVFDRDGTGPDYLLDDSVLYFGNYFTDLEAGDVIVFMPGDEAARMYPAAEADFKPVAPYGPGLYRVGTDIEPGTYTIAYDAGAARNAQQDSGAFVMKDLEFDDDSMTVEKYVVAGGSQTVTVEKGDFLELYATTATPAE